MVGGGGEVVWVKLLCFGGLGVGGADEAGVEYCSHLLAVMNQCLWQTGGMGPPPAAPAFCLSSVSRGCPCVDNAWNTCGHTCSSALARAR